MSNLEILDRVIFYMWIVNAAYFVQRFFMYRRVVSLCIAAMALGWGMVGFGASIGFSDFRVLFDGLALLVGVSLMGAILAVEISNR